MTFNDQRDKNQKAQREDQSSKNQQNKDRTDKNQTANRPHEEAEQPGPNVAEQAGPNVPEQGSEQQREVIRREERENKERATHDEQQHGPVQQDLSSNPESVEPSTDGSSKLEQDRLKVLRAKINRTPEEDVEMRNLEEPTRGTNV